MQREVGQFAKPRLGKTPMAAPVRRSLALLLALAALLAVSITADGRGDHTVYAAPQAQTLTTFTTAGSHSYTIPSGVIRITITLEGADGGGGGAGGRGKCGNGNQEAYGGDGGAGGDAGSPGATAGSSGENGSASNRCGGGGGGGGGGAGGDSSASGIGAALAVEGGDGGRGGDASGASVYDGDGGAGGIGGNSTGTGGAGGSSGANNGGTGKAGESLSVRRDVSAGQVLSISLGSGGSGGGGGRRGCGQGSCGTSSGGDGTAGDDGRATITDSSAELRPSAPLNVTVEPTTDSAGSLDVEWSTPNSDGGSSVTHYDIRYRIRGTSAWSQIDGRIGNSFTIWSLQLGTAYQASVRAANNNGDGPWSATAEGTTAATAPDTPDAPAVEPSSTEPDELGVSWTEPEDNGAAIEHYDIRYREGSAGIWREASGLGTTTLSYTIKRLKAGTEYQVGVRAHNAEGDSEWSDTTSESTPAFPPDKPDPPTVLAVSTTTLRALWTEPDDNQLAITSYDLQYRSKGSTLWTQVLVLSELSYRITGLQSNTEYEIEVRAENSAGDSEWSEPALTFTLTTDATAFTDEEISTNAYLADTPSVRALAEVGGANPDSGYRWELGPSINAMLVKQPDLKPGWRITLQAAISDTASTTGAVGWADVDMDTRVVACGGSELKRLGDVDLCTADTGITLAQIQSAGLLTFTPYVYRASDDTRFLGTQHARFILAEQPRSGEENYFTLTLPTVEHRYSGGILSLQVSPVRGTEHSHVVINNTFPPLSFSTPRTGAGQQLYTLRVRVDPTAQAVSYNVRGAFYNAAETDVEITLESSDDGDTTYPVPAESWVYTPYTPARFVRLQPFAEVEAPASLLTPVPSDARLDLAISQVLNGAGFGEEGEEGVISVPSAKTSLVFFSSLILGMSGAVATAKGTRSPSMVNVFVGMMLFTMTWAILGLTIAGLPPGVVLPPLLLPLLLAIPILKGRLT